jgi:Family of unknown function (DUF6188)
MMKTDSRPAVEEHDRYVLPLAGRSVSRCYVDYAFGICFYVGGPSTEIRIEGKIRLLANGRDEVVVEPGTNVVSDPRSLGPLLILFGKSVIWAHAFKNGALKVLFEGDLMMEVDPGGKYEAWELSAKGGLKLVSVPGGSIAYWKPLAS